MATVRKTGLGKGLGALFAAEVPEKIEQIEEKEEKQENEEKKEEKLEGKVLNLKINEVEPNKNQPRKSFNDESLEELAESIKQYGLIQPIIVTKEEGYYAIVAGERRWRACKKAGMKEIPAIVRENDERKNKEIALIENIQREDLNPIEKARSFRTLLDEYGLTQQELADTLGISRSALTNTVRLLNLISLRYTLLTLRTPVVPLSTGDVNTSPSGILTSARQFSNTVCVLWSAIFIIETFMSVQFPLVPLTSTY